MRFLRIVSGLACAIALNANAAQVESYTQYLPEGTNLSVLVQKIGSTTPVVDYHGDQMGLPASTMKIFTASLGSKKSVANASAK